VAGADRGSVEGTGAEGCVLAGDAAVYGVRGVDDKAVGDGEAVDGREDDAVEVQRAIVKAGNTAYCDVSVVVLAMSWVFRSTYQHCLAGTLRTRLAEPQSR